MATTRGKQKPRAQTAEEMRPLPRRERSQVVIAYDGSEPAERALAEAGRLLAARRALVLVVWKSGLGFELLELPAISGIPPAPVDVRTALDIDEATYERARRLAEHGARVAREAGFDAEGLVVAEDPDVSISRTIVRVARERGSAAIVLGERAQGRLEEVLLGSISRDVIRYAPCPVLVTRHA
jgi:nucleotide-binding universal stress UspA family protein